MTTSVNELLKQEPGEILEWLKSVQSGNNLVTNDYNWWLGIAEVANSKARKETVSEKKLQWAEVAIQVYDYLEDRAYPNSNSTDCSAKMLSVAMINQLGVVAGHPVLDPQATQEWFFKRLTGSLEEVTKMASNWQTRPIEEILQLRNLKNRLNVIEALRSAGYLQQDAELTKWLEIKSKLP